MRCIQCFLVGFPCHQALVIRTQEADHVCGFVQTRAKAAVKQLRMQEHWVYCSRMSKVWMRLPTGFGWFKTSAETELQLCRSSQMPVKIRQSGLSKKPKNMSKAPSPVSATNFPTTRASQMGGHANPFSFSTQKPRASSTNGTSTTMSLKCRRRHWLAATFHENSSGRQARGLELNITVVATVVLWRHPSMKLTHAVLSVVPVLIISVNTKGVFDRNENPPGPMYAQKKFLVDEGDFSNLIGLRKKRI